MGTLFLFTLAMGLMMAVMLVIYRLLMANEKQPSFNRAALLGIYLVSAIAAFTVIAPGEKPVTTGAEVSDGEIIEMMIAQAAMHDAPAQQLQQSGSAVSWITAVVWVWICGVLLSAASVVPGLMRIRRMIRNSARHRIDGIRVAVCDDDTVSPFSLAGIVVMSRKDFNENAPMIMAHEMRHIALHHTIDIAIGRIVASLQWFNPAAWLMLKELKSVHEFQADQAVIDSGADMHAYQLLLLSKLARHKFTAMANYLNHGIMKRRIIMMQRGESGHNSRIWALALIAMAFLTAGAVSSRLPASLIEEFRSVDMLPAQNVPTQKTPVDAGPEQETILPETESETAPEAAPTAAPEKPADGKPLSVILPETQVVAFTSAPEIKIEGTETETETEAENKPETDSDFEKKITVKVEGKEVPFADFKKMSPGSIKSMKIDKSKGSKAILEVTLKDEGDNTPEDRFLPEYPGGIRKMTEFIKSNARIPEGVKLDKKKRTIVQFEVDPSGKVINPHVVNSSGNPQLDNEALRVIGSMPEFIPATENGKAVTGQMTIPVPFVEKS